LHAPEADLHNGFYDKPEAVKKWRSWWLPRLAAAVQAEPDAWKDQAARIWFTAILAHAASDAGDQASALKVLQEAGDAVTNSDDLAFARCVVLQRQGKDHPAEIEAWKTFLHGFPKSPLHDGAILRLATTQQAAGLCDDAVLTVASLQDREKGDTAIEDYFGQSFYPSDYTDLPPAASALSPSLTLAEPVQVAQHLDALLAFAPVEQLARLASRRSQFTPERWEQVRAVILGRLLSEGVTQEVATFLPKDGDRAAAEQIAGLAAKAKTDGTADAWIALGDAWAAARGRVTFQPMWSNRAEIYQEVNSDDPERLRNQNAVTLGLQDEAHAGNRLLAIDELANAKTAWEAALAKATPGSAQQAHALGQILEAMPKIAAAHPWARDFAARNGWSDSAAAFYATLQKDCASSPEARRAARPSFVNPDQAAQPAPEPPAANTANGKPLPDAFVQPAVEWTQPHYDFGIPYLKHREFIYPDLANLGEAAEPAAGEQLEDFNVLLQDLYAIDFAGRGARRQLESLRDRSRKSYRIWNEGCVHSAIEDLTALTADPSVTPVVLARYASLRLAVINVSAFLVSLELRPVHGDLVTGPEADEWVFQALTKAMTEPALKSVADRIGCLRLLVLANRTISIPVTGADDNKEGESTIETRDYAAVEKEALAWLKAFPKSAKRQEAWLLCVRAAYRARRPLLRSVGANFPESGTSVGSLYVRLPQPNLLPWNPGIIESRIAAYEKEFPSPRYAAELNDLRSGLAVAKKDWPRAIALCTALLHDPQHPDLHLEAALRLTNLFARLGDPEVRPDLLAAIKESPAARADLVRYLDATDESTDLEPLTFWTAWLREQVTQS
jgi:hypothetical protein